MRIFLKRSSGAKTYFYACVVILSGIGAIRQAELMKVLKIAIF
jgi:hypothetical protein